MTIYEHTDEFQDTSPFRTDDPALEEEWAHLRYTRRDLALLS